MDTNTIVIGAGPAGLATGASLRRAGVPFIILEREHSVAATWRRHYDRLHIHTPKRLSALPFRPFPRSYPTYPSRDQIIAYLDEYAAAFDLEPRFGEEVTRCTYSDQTWTVETITGRFEASNIVVATGFSSHASIPSWPGLDAFEGLVFHTSQYVNGSAFAGQNVLVVGFGNSGAEIALDLWEHGARPTISLRGTANVVPRDVFGIPATYFALASKALPPAAADRANALTIRLSIGDLARLGLQKRSYGPFVQMLQHSQIPVIDVGTVALIRQGKVHVRGAIDHFEGNRVHFADGKSDHFDAVILATGYTTGLPPLFPQNADVFDDAGRPRTSGRRAAPGLYFCGFTLTSTGFLRQIAREARAIAESISRGTTLRAPA